MGIVCFNTNWIRSYWGDKGVSKAAKLAQGAKFSQGLSKAGQILSKGDNLAFSGGNEIIGRGIQRGSTTIEEMTNAKIILKKDANGKFILTGYPN